MDLDTFKDLLFQRAKTFGFEDCELYCVSGQGVMLSIPSGEEHSIKTGVALRASIGNKTGSAYSENISEKAIDFLLASAFENVTLTAEVPVNYCSSGLLYPVLDNHVPEILDIGKVKEKRAEICAELTQYPSLAKTSGEVYALSETFRVINTRGLDVKNTVHYVYCSLSGISERAGLMKDSLHYRSGSRLEDIDASGLVTEICNRADCYYGAQSLLSGKYNILYANNAASYLVQGFSVFFSAVAVQKGLSLWKNKLGCQVANPCVTVLDDPLDIRGVFARTFDVEGYPVARKTLIEKGILKSYLHNANTARQFADVVPGNTWRLDYKYEPGIHPSNMVLAPGDKSVNDLLRELGEGLYITDMTAYFHGAGINPVSGDYSMPVTGFWVKNGKIDRPVDGITVAGNLYEMMNHIISLGNDFLYGLPTSFRPGAPMGYGCYGSPSIIVSDVSVGGL